MPTLCKSSDLTAKTVANTDGVLVGTVREVVFDLETWRVTELQVKIDKPQAKELGLRTPFFGSLLVLIGVDHVQSANDQILVDLAKDDFADYVKERKKAAK